MLTNATVKAARARARPYRIGDGGGLVLAVLPSGTKSWRWRCRIGGKEQLLTFGLWPELDLAGARERRDRARALLDRGEDPRTASSANTLKHEFETVARLWFDHQSPSWSDAHAADVLASLERDVFPAIGAEPIGAIDAPAVLRALRAIEQRGAIETARRVRQRISDVFAFAAAEGLCEADPAAIVRKALAPAPASHRQPALIDIGDARALLAAAELVDARAITKLASSFLALTAVRLACVREARWAEFEQLDGPSPLWRIPAARMKLKKARKADPTAGHLVPLSSHAVSILRRAAELRSCAISQTDQNACLVFPGRAASRPIGEAAIGDLYARAGFAGRHVPHGWRATFSTICNELKLANRALIDMALAHTPKDKVEAAYNRAELLDQRRDLFQRWADLLMPTPAPGSISID